MPKKKDYFPFFWWHFFHQQFFLLKHHGHVRRLQEKTAVAARQGHFAPPVEHNLGLDYYLQCLENYGGGRNEGLQS